MINAEERKLLSRYTIFEIADFMIKEKMLNKFNKADFFAYCIRGLFQ